MKHGLIMRHFERMCFFVLSTTLIALFVNKKNGVSILNTVFVLHSGYLRRK